MSEVRRRRRALGALIALAPVTLWPVGDPAATVSLSVATIQRLVIMQLVASGLLLSLSTDALVRLTRPAPVDTVLRRITHPGLAMAMVTVLGTLSLAPPVADGGARSMLARAVVLLITLVGNLILWWQELTIVPGTRHLSPIARAVRIRLGPRRHEPLDRVDLRESLALPGPAPPA